MEPRLSADAPARPALAGMRAVLIDIDGVLYVEDEAVAGALAHCRKHAVMVGDDIESDIGGALDAGLRALVRTRKYRPDVAAASGIEPTAVVASIADVPPLLRVA